MGGMVLIFCTFEAPWQPCPPLILPVLPERDLQGFQGPLFGRAECAVPAAVVILAVITALAEATLAPAEAHAVDPALVVLGGRRRRVHHHLRVGNRRRDLYRLSRESSTATGNEPF